MNKVIADAKVIPPDERELRCFLRDTAESDFAALLISFGRTELA